MQIATMKLFLSGALLFLCFYMRAAGPLHPANLNCEYSSHPLGINTRQPRLGWTSPAPAETSCNRPMKLL